MKVYFSSFYQHESMQICLLYANVCLLLLHQSKTMTNNVTYFLLYLVCCDQGSIAHVLLTVGHIKHSPSIQKSAHFCSVQV